ncbi:MAG: SART-1 protein [Monoraphidium minutum]|nr:MAG: SART-1 protein [Monoraphidium minutum]
MATSGGRDDVVMSIEETNKMRVSLGLKPLSMEAPQQRAPEARKPAAEEAKPDADAIRAKLAEARDKRRREAELHNTRGLGETGGDADDVASWVVKMRTAREEPPAKRQQREGDRGKRRARGGGGGDDEGEEGGVDELAGARVRHDADELAEGETMVLTLADAPILDARGGLNDAADELEEVARAQDKARAKARRAAGKEAKPLWMEDGRLRSMLDKYDEEEEEAGLTLDEAGRAAAAAARQDEVRQRLAAAAAAALDAVTAPAMGGAADYMTAEEAAAGGGGGGGLKKKKKKRKLRTTRAAADEDDDDDGGGGDGGGGDGGGLDLDALEAAARAEGGGDLGSREARQQRREAQEKAATADAAERAARFQRAVEKTNWASAALRAPAGDAGGDDDDEAEAELVASLSRARRLAQRSGAAGAANGEGGAASAAAPESVEEIAQRLGKKRAEDEERLKEELAAGGSDLFNAATEFVRNIGGAGEEDEEGRQQVGGGGDAGNSAGAEASYMDVDGDDAPAAAAAALGGGADGDADVAGTTSSGAGGAPKPKQRNIRKRGGWVSAEDDEGQAGAGGQNGQQRQGHGQTEGVGAGVAGDRAMGRGLAGALTLLHDTGALKGQTEWAGRTNEKKAVALIGLEDVYTGGTQEDRMARSIEAALTQRDEFGRVMTPKERFRTLCHQFHGIFPSKNKEAHRQRKYLEDVAVKRNTTSEDPSGELDRLRALQAQLGTPYLPLDGKAGLPGRAAGDDDDGPPLPVARGSKPQLGGGLTPLVGDRKVEAMLGLSKPPAHGGGRGGGGGGGGRGGMHPPKPKGK